MKIRELFEDEELPKDGRGNVVVWDSKRRLEVLVPEKEIPTLTARNQLVGGALNMPTPSKYPEAPSLHNKQQSSPQSKQIAPTTKFGHFKQGFQKGFKGTNKFIKDLPHTPVGQAANKVNNFLQKQRQTPK